MASKLLLRAGLAVALVLGALFAVNSAPAPARAATSLACDIYAAGGTPCIAAHSTTRALYAAYSGSLYQVRRSSDNTTRDIGPLTRGGTANAAGQDSFCSGTTCVITVVYDQSGHGNNLAYQGTGGAGGQDTPATATSESLTVNGGKAYSLYINPKNSYWHNGSASGVPTGSAPEGEYMVTSGTHVNGGCCFDYGNSETDRRADGAGAMDAIYFAPAAGSAAAPAAGRGCRPTSSTASTPEAASPGTPTSGRSPAWSRAIRATRPTAPSRPRSSPPAIAEGGLLTKPRSYEALTAP
jgi:hypothetical protein